MRELEFVWMSLCIASASLLYLKGARTQPLGPRQVGPTMQYNVLFIYYGVAGKGDLSLGFPRLLPEPFVHHVLALSCQVGPVVASGTVRHIA